MIRMNTRIGTSSKLIRIFTPYQRFSLIILLIYCFSYLNQFEDCLGDVHCMSVSVCLSVCHYHHILKWEPSLVLDVCLPVCFYLCLFVSACLSICCLYSETSMELGESLNVQSLHRHKNWNNQRPLKSKMGRARCFFSKRNSGKRLKICLCFRKTNPPLCMVYGSVESLKDRSKFTRYLGRVFGKNLPKKGLRHPPFLVENFFSKESLRPPNFFFRNKRLHPPNFSRKKSLHPLFFEKKSSPPVDVPGPGTG